MSSYISLSSQENYPAPQTTTLKYLLQASFATEKWLKIQPTLRKIIFVRSLQNFPTTVSFSRLSVLCSHEKWNRSFPHETPVTTIYCVKINCKDKLCYPFTSCVNFIYQVLNFPHCRYGKIPVIHCLIIQKSTQSSTWGHWSQEWEFCFFTKKKKKV